MPVSYQIKTLDQYHEQYRRSVQDPEGFWAEIASQFHWKKPWDRVLSWNFREPSIKWFEVENLI
jgi:acetyl-CoA synthetase